MNKEQLMELKNKNKGTLTDEETINETRKMMEASQENLNEVLEVLDILGIDLTLANKYSLLRKTGVSKTRAKKALGIQKGDEQILDKYHKHSSSLEWNKFCLEQLGEL